MLPAQSWLYEPLDKTGWPDTWTLGEAPCILYLTMEDEYLSARAAGRHLGVSPRTIRRWIEAGRIAATKGPDGWHISKRELEALGRTAPRRAEAEAQQGRPPQGIAPGEALGVLVEEMRARREETAQLREENRNLAGQVGYLQAQVQNLQEEVKLLTAGRVEGESQPHKPWWRRLLRR